MHSLFARLLTLSLFFSLFHSLLPKNISGVAHLEYLATARLEYHATARLEYHAAARLEYHSCKQDDEGGKYEAVEKAALQQLRCQYLYFCTRKSSKVCTWFRVPGLSKLPGY